LTTFEKLSNLNPNLNPNSTVMQPENARSLLNMLETVVKPGGTGYLAFLPNVRVAGKTGTTRKFIDGQYSETQYLAWFVGLVPADAPRLVMAVVIDEPQGDNYYGGKIAAPIFAKVMSDALRLLNRETE